MQRRGRILSVSHDPELLRTRHLLFESEGYDVRSTDSVQEAIVIANRERPDLVVIGHSLRDGYRSELVSALGTIPVLVLNRPGEDPCPSVENILSLDPVEVLSAVRRILNRRMSEKEYPSEAASGM